MGPGVPVLCHRPFPGHGMDATRALDADHLATLATTQSDPGARGREAAGGRAREMSAATMTNIR